MSQDCCFINPSYFYFNESGDSGTNDSYYFTYFTEYSNSTSACREYIEAGFFITNCVLSCLLNGLILVSMTRDLRSVSNVFIFNMAVADLVYGLIGPVLAWVRIQGDWNLGPLMCHLAFYLQSVCGCVVCWSIAAVSVDRYIHIVHPMRVHLTITLHQAGIIIAAIWLLSVTIMSPLGIFFKVIESPIPYAVNNKTTAHICTLFWPRGYWYTLSTVVMIILGCFVAIPAALMTWCYYRCVKHIRTIRKSLTSRMDSFGSHSGALDLKKRRSLREYKVIRTLMILLVVYLIAWGPVFSVLPGIVIDLYMHTASMRSQAFVWALGLAQFNAVVNPIVYGLSLRTVRSNLVRRFWNVR